MSRKIESMVNLYQLSKTVRNSLLPTPETEQHFNEKLYLEEDIKRAKDYKQVKEYIDKYHKKFIEASLSELVLNDLPEFAEIYYSTNADKDALLHKLEQKMRKQIVSKFKSMPEFSKLDKEKMITEILPSFLSEENELQQVKNFQKFTTYFKGFFTNRKNLYSDEEKSTAIAFRCINENLPKFLDNAKSFKKVKESLPTDKLLYLNSNYHGVNSTEFEDIFSVDYYCYCMSQGGIELYNTVLGGYTTQTDKIQGLNETINLYNQQQPDKDKKLPLLKPLYKQLLSDRETNSFIPEKFEKDTDLLSAIEELFSKSEGLNFAVEELNKIFTQFNNFDLSRIYVANGSAITEISNHIFDNWNTIREQWNEEYSEKVPMKKGGNIEKYYENRDKAYKAIGSFSILEIQRLGDSSNSAKKDSISKWYIDWVNVKTSTIKQYYNSFKIVLQSDEIRNKKLIKNDKAVAIIKDLLDSVKELKNTLQSLLGTRKETDKDDIFYGQFEIKYDILSQIDEIYNKVRNYLTQKPYSNDKIKLNFSNPEFLGGWDANKEPNYLAVILLKDNNYFLAIMDKKSNRNFVDIPTVKENEPYYEKMEYKFLPNPYQMLPKVFFSNKRIEYFAPSKEILKIRENGSFTKGNTFNIEDCHKFIDFYKSSISKHKDWAKFNFKFKETGQYNDIGEFYKDISQQGYKMNFRKVPEFFINELVKEGKLYLFQIYNKDFSPSSHGKPNLHSLYFKMLFDEQNLKNVVFKLNGEAEMFYRKASLKLSETTIHKAHLPLDNKNPINEKKNSTFNYDLIKDKRYTTHKYLLHTPITINYKANGFAKINQRVKELLKKCDNNYIIGIDRGERNLIYITVIDENGKIIEQHSKNIIDNGNKVDYHQLLDKRETEMINNQKSWAAVGSIKELKEGYLSQVVHQICQLIEKYDAIIVMEDLNSGFKNSRAKIKKQVYQKFETMLTEKLKYMADKSKPLDENGSILKGYQLVNVDSKYATKKQNGFIFYIPAWNTSKIDPVTGFVDLLHPKYNNVEKSQEFFRKFDSITYNYATDYFEFAFDYDNFGANADYKKKWTICTYGDRIKTERNKNANNQFESTRVDLTNEFKELFNRYNINYNNDNLKECIINQTEKAFFEKLIKLLKLSLQMRNSKTNSTNPEDDFLISPVADENGVFYDSRKYINIENPSLPKDADANGAYNIARKGLWVVKQIKAYSEDDNFKNLNTKITNADWLEFVQK